MAPLLSENWYRRAGEVTKLHAVKKSEQNWGRVGKNTLHAQKRNKVKRAFCKWKGKTFSENVKHKTKWPIKTISSLKRL